MYWNPDIESCFDNIGHEWLLENFPIKPELLRKVFEIRIHKDNSYHTSKKGIPQGGSVSSCLCNWTLDGIEGVCRERLYQWKALCGVSKPQKSLRALIRSIGIDAEPFGADICAYWFLMYGGFLYRYADDFLFILMYTATLSCEQSCFRKLMIFFLPEGWSSQKEKQPCAKLRMDLFFWDGESVNKMER